MENSFSVIFRKVYVGSELRFRKGFSLFELAVVVLIGIIIVGLLFFSVQNLLIQTKVSRVKEEHRILTRALQNYRLDYSVLPQAVQGLRALERPTAYVGTVPRDPFQGPSGTYLYLQPNSNEMASVIISPGPDGQFSLPTELWQFASFHEVNQAMVPNRVITRQMAEEENDDEFSASIRIMNETHMAILKAYIELGSFDPATGKGDIITVINH